MTGRLGELAAAVVEPPVRLVKMIGDAAMVVGPEPGPVVEAALALVEAAENEGEDFPLLRAGVASGQALARAGDWYGRPVNLASRITAIARPGERPGRRGPSARRSPTRTPGRSQASAG